jgi:hypothetical protein
MMRWRLRAPLLAAVIVCLVSCQRVAGSDAGAPGGPPPPERRPSHVPRTALGVNIGEVNYYTPQVAFLDLVKQAADWSLGGNVPTVDEHGWPKALPGGRPVGFLANAGLGGRFVALWDGEGTVAVTHGGRPIAEKPGRLEVELEPGTVHIRILHSSPSNPVRRIRVVPAEHERDHEKLVFHPRFVELVRPFGVLRFHDWTRILGSKVSRWSDRPKPDDWSQGTDKGVALEYTLELCNRVRADCWLNVPHMADDEYLIHMAETVRDRLDPSLKAYVEYSNEIWNYRQQGDWCQRAGESLGFPREWNTRLRYQAHRSIEIFRIFERVLGRDRLIRVLAGQMWDRRLAILAEWEKAYLQADVLAVAPYFGEDLTSDENVSRLRGLDPGAVVERCAGEVEKLRPAMRSVRALAKRLGLPLVAYEGGQHLVTTDDHYGNEPLQRLLHEANRSPAMGRVYGKYLDMWREEGGELMMLYMLVGSYSKYGRWGLVERMWDPLEASPKYQAAVEFMARQRPWWSPAPGVGP